MYKHSELTKQIINAGFTVHNELGFGFLEKVYHNALIIELTKQGFDVEAEKQIDVYYDGQIAGQFYADLIVNKNVIVEIKAVSTLNPAHETQLVNYLKATKIKVGLLLNFGKSLEVKRKVF
ncbi:MAG: GxxExxY protein [Anaerohalosphaeraceae bacterium]|nr:GxxExxY protein [Anaerohalosphaeraceae bacterium]